MIAKIISGGQNGVDLAALVVAKELGIPTGGWMPRRFLTEDGPRLEYARLYGMQEMDDVNYPARTRRNVHWADATIILVDDMELLTGGTALTEREANRQQRPLLVECLPLQRLRLEAIRHWLHFIHKGHILNVAGPRESKAPGIHERAKAFLLAVLSPEGGYQ